MDQVNLTPRSRCAHERAIAAAMQLADQSTVPFRLDVFRASGRYNAPDVKAIIEAESLEEFTSIA